MQSGENLARLRKLRGLSQREVAEELNVTRQSISQWEAGRAFPSIQNQIALSRLYGVPLDELYPEETTEKEEVETAGTPEEPEPEEPDGVSPTMEVTQKEQPRQGKWRRIWRVLALAAIYISIYIWGELTRSSTAAKLMMRLVTYALLVMSILYIINKVADSLIDYLRRKK